MSRIIPAALSASLLLAAPFLLPTLFPLAWIAFVPLFWALERAATLWRAILYGWLIGLLTHVIGFHWLVYTISVFGGFDYPVSTVVFVIYAALQGLAMALLALLVKRFGFGPLHLFPALFWVVLEFRFPLLFPWFLANSQSSFASFIQTADLVGPHGASFLVMWLNTMVAGALFKRGRNSKSLYISALCFAACVVASVAYGLMRLQQVGAQISAAPKLSVAAVQGNIEVGMKWDPKQTNANLDIHTSLTRGINGATVVLWPESAVEEWLPENLPALSPRFVESLQLKDAYLIFGARSFRGNPAAANPKVFNSAFLMDPKGVVLKRYHKQVLLAFGEYLPFSSILSKLPALPFAEGFTPGDGPRIFDLPGGVRIAPLICYEDLMPELSRAFVKTGQANVLVNLTNDAWYGRTVAPWQHARLAQWRAIETRRSLLRVTNTGVTTSINAKGEIGETLPIFSAGVLNAQVAILEGETLYVRFGNWFAWGITLISAAIVLLRWRRQE
jgi:apolipoprotein N-acyltransferase